MRPKPKHDNTRYLNPKAPTALYVMASCESVSLGPWSWLGPGMQGLDRDMLLCMFMTYYYIYYIYTCIHSKVSIGTCYYVCLYDILLYIYIYIIYIYICIHRRI